MDQVWISKDPNLLTNKYLYWLTYFLLNNLFMYLLNLDLWKFIEHI